MNERQITIVVHRSLSLGMCCKAFNCWMDLESQRHYLKAMADVEDGTIVTFEWHTLYSDVSERAQRWTWHYRLNRWNRSDS